MQFVIYFVVSLLSYLGLAAGIALVKIAPEEQKPLEKLAKTLSRILLFLIFGFILFFYFNDLFSFLVLLAYFAFLVFANHKVKDSLKLSMLNYAVIGVLLPLSAKNVNLFAIESSLIFLFGTLNGCNLYDKKGKNYFKIIFYNLGFLILATAVYFFV